MCKEWISSYVLGDGDYDPKKAKEYVFEHFDAEDEALKGLKENVEKAAEKIKAERLSGYPVARFLTLSSQLGILSSLPIESDEEDIDQRVRDLMETIRELYRLSIQLGPA